MNKTYNNIIRRNLLMCRNPYTGIDYENMSKGDKEYIDKLINYYVNCL